MSGTSGASRASPLEGAAANVRLDCLRTSPFGEDTRELSIELERVGGALLDNVDEDEDADDSVDEDDVSDFIAPDCGPED